MSTLSSPRGVAVMPIWVAGSNTLQRIRTAGGVGCAPRSRSWRRPRLDQCRPRSATGSAHTGIADSSQRPDHHYLDRQSVRRGAAPRCGDAIGQPRVQPGVPSPAQRGRHRDVTRTLPPSSPLAIGRAGAADSSPAGYPATSRPSQSPAPFGVGILGDSGGRMLDAHAVARSLTDAEFTPAQAGTITNLWEWGRVPTMAGARCRRRGCRGRAAAGRGSRVRRRPGADRATRPGGQRRPRS